MLRISRDVIQLSETYDYRKHMTARYIQCLHKSCYGYKCTFLTVDNMREDAPCLPCEEAETSPFILCSFHSILWRKCTKKNYKGP